jgi:outer membrane protein assembly factor BamB
MFSRWLGRMALGLLVLPALAWAEDWPQFRGTGSPVPQSEQGLPVEWAKDKNVAWKAAIPGVAW